jgi:hypothetical protein
VREEISSLHVKFERRRKETKGKKSQKELENGDFSNMGKP